MKKVLDFVLPIDYIRFIIPLILLGFGFGFGMLLLAAQLLVLRSPGRLEFGIRKREDASTPSLLHHQGVDCYSRTCSVTLMSVDSQGFSSLYTNSRSVTFAMLPLMGAMMNTRLSLCITLKELIVCLKNLSEFLSKKCGNAFSV